MTGTGLQFLRPGPDFRLKFFLYLYTVMASSGLETRNYLVSSWHVKQMKSFLQKLRVFLQRKVCLKFFYKFIRNLLLNYWISWFLEKNNNGIAMEYIYTATSLLEDWLCSRTWGMRVEWRMESLALFCKTQECGWIVHCPNLSSS